MPQKLDARRLVRSFGGPTQLHARLTNEGHTLTVKAINLWVYRRSIPSKWLAVLSEMAEKDRRPLHLHKYTEQNDAHRSAGRGRPRESRADEPAAFLD